MKPADSEQRLREHLTARGFEATRSPTRMLVAGALDFYQTVPASGLDDEPGADMLLYQWGTYDWGEGPFFELDLTRQFVEAGAQGDDAMSQLSCAALFAPTPALEALGDGNRWCAGRGELPAFVTFIESGAAWAAVRDRVPTRVRIDWSAL